jgi:hypothetical protein
MFSHYQWHDVTVLQKRSYCCNATCNSYLDFSGVLQFRRMSFRRTAFRRKIPRYVYHGNRYISSWYRKYYGITMVLYDQPWFYHGGHHGNTMLKHGVTVVIPCNHGAHWVITKSPWCYHGITMVPTWYHHMVHCSLFSYGYTVVSPR